MHHRLAVSGKGQAPIGLVVPAQRAGHRDQAITQQLRLESAGGRAQARGDRVAARGCRQANLQALLRAGVAGGAADDVAPPQVVDARAAQLAQTRQRRRIRRGAEQQVHAMPRALERRALVRRAQAHEVVDACRPAQAAALDQRGVVQRAARHQAAHAVAQHHQAFDRHRPGVEQPFHQLRQDAAVGRDTEAAVVVQVDRRVAQLARQRVAMIVARTLPLQVVHAKAVQQHEGSRRRIGQARTHRKTFERQRPAGLPKRHRDGQRVVGGGQVVTQHTVERGDDRFALRVGRLARVGCRQRRAQPAEQRLGAAAHHARDAAHRLVDQAREAARALVGRRRAGAGQVRQAGDARVHRLHQAGQAGHRVGGQAGGAAQIGGLQERLRHARV